MIFEGTWQNRDNFTCELFKFVWDWTNSISLIFFSHSWNECQFSLSAAFLTQTVCLDDTTVKFEIWDTAGQERYHSLAPMYYRGAQAAIVVYDITNTVSNSSCLVLLLHSICLFLPFKQKPSTSLKQALSLSRLTHVASTFSDGAHSLLT